MQANVTSIYFVLSTTRAIRIHNRQWLRILVDVAVAHWLRIRADNFYLFNDASARIVRTLVCLPPNVLRTSAHICSLSRGQWLQIRVDVLTIRLYYPYL